MINRKIDIFLDECGDLGIQGERSSRYFVVAATATPERESFVRIVKRAHRKLGVKGKHAVEFKFNSSSLSIKHFFLQGIADADCWIVWSAYDKLRWKDQLLGDKNEFYCNACTGVLADILKLTPSRVIEIIVDRRSSNKTQRDIFDASIQRILSMNHAGYFEPRLRIRHLDPCGSEGLQVHDFIIGSIFQKIERNESSFYCLIEKKILLGCMNQK